MKSKEVRLLSFRSAWIKYWYTLKMKFGSNTDIEANFSIFSDSSQMILKLGRNILDTMGRNLAKFKQFDDVIFNSKV